MPSNRRGILSGWVSSGLVSLGLIAAEGGAQPAVFTKVALNGEGLVGLAGGHTIQSFNEATIGAGGHVVAIAGIDAAGVTGVIVGMPQQTPTVLVISGTAAPGTPAGVVFSSFSNAWPDALGRVVIEATVAGPGITTANDRGLWLHNGASLVFIAREGQSVAGISGLPAGTTMVGFNSPAFNAGRVVFAANLAGSSIGANDRSIWFFNGTTLSMIVREGNSSIIAGAAWGSSIGEPQINPGGQILFQASLVTGSVDNNEVIVFGSPTQISAATVVFRDGDPAPGLAAGVLINGPFAEAATYANTGMAINLAGDIAVHAGLRGTGVTGLNDSALYVRPGTGGPASLVFRQDEVIPGGPVFFPPRYGPPASVNIGNDGVLAWRTLMTGSLINEANDLQVLRRTSSGALHRILREASQAPGEADGVAFGGNNPAVYGVTMGCNAAGQMLLQASVIGGSLTTAQTMFWVNDPSDNATHRIARPGQAVSVIGIAGFPGGSIAGGAVDHFASTQIGRPTSISDNGNVVLRMTVNSTSPPAQSRGGVFVAGVAPVASGACCRGATCQVASAADCVGALSGFAGAGTVCAAPPPAGSAVSPCCLADFNHVGEVTVQDVFDFLAAFFATDPLANINAVGGVTVQDVFDYLAAYFAGCG